MKDPAAGTAAEVKQTALTAHVHSEEEDKEEDKKDKKRAIPLYLKWVEVETALTDDRVSRVRDALIAAKVKPGGACDGFIVWLGEMVGNLKATRSLISGQPRKVEPFARKLETSIDDMLWEITVMPQELRERLREYFRNSNLSFEVASLDWHIDRAIVGLTGLQLAMSSVASELAKSKPGRQSKGGRNELLDLVKKELSKLGVAKVSVAPLAGAVLIAAGIDAPSDGRSRAKDQGEK